MGNTHIEEQRESKAGRGGRTCDLHSGLRRFIVCVRMFWRPKINTTKDFLIFPRKEAV